MPARTTLLASISKLAQDVREKLASNPEMLKELQSRAPFILTQSVPALRSYNEGLQLARANKYSEAAKKFEEATAEDPTFAHGVFATGTGLSRAEIRR